MKVKTKYEAKPKVIGYNIFLTREEAGYIVEYTKNSLDGIKSSTLRDLITNLKYKLDSEA